jgi:hypothetical protein
VVCPPLIPKRAGDRIKTDRRDAASLARLHRAGELTAVWVPDPGHEAMHALRWARQLGVPVGDAPPARTLDPRASGNTAWSKLPDWTLAIVVASL